MKQSQPNCTPTQAPDFSDITNVELNDISPLGDYLGAIKIANQEASIRLGEHMLLSWYDRDRDFESPQHASECHADSAIPGYVDYALSRKASLRISIEDGRFVFFYLPVKF